MRGFKSAGQAQRFPLAHEVILNFFRCARHLMRSENYRLLRAGSFKERNMLPMHQDFAALSFSGSCGTSISIPINLA